MCTEIQFLKGVDICEIALSAQIFKVYIENVCNKLESIIITGRNFLQDLLELQMARNPLFLYVTFIKSLKILLVDILSGYVCHWSWSNIISSVSIAQQRVSLEFSSLSGEKYVYGDVRSAEKQDYTIIRYHISL